MAKSSTWRWKRRQAAEVDPSLQPVFRVGPGVDVSLVPGRVHPGLVLAKADSLGQADAAALIEAQRWQGPQPLVLLVAEDLGAPGCASAFGYANPAAGTAIVSTFRLAADGRTLLEERLSKVIAHEWMHLRGRRHCRQAGCLMHPVQTVAELDARGHSLCPRCRRQHSWKGAALAASVALALSGALDLTVSALQTKSRPFHGRTSDNVARVFYQDTEILRLPVQASPLPQADAQQIADGLNRLFAEIDPAPLHVAAANEQASVSAGGRTLFTVTAAMAGEQPPQTVARHFAAQVQPLLEGKGRPGESCPLCHIGRREQVREAVARPPRFWR